VSISHKDLISLIKICASNSVREIRCGELVVSFDRQTRDETNELSSPRPKVAESVIKEVRDEALLKQSFESTEEIMAHLQIEDPVQYERMLLEGELEGEERTSNH
jgi:uncharacterized protein with PhoU and TrkA domain